MSDHKTVWGSSCFSCVFPVVWMCSTLCSVGKFCCRFGKRLGLDMDWTIAWDPDSAKKSPGSVKAPECGPLICPKPDSWVRLEPDWTKPCPLVCCCSDKNMYIMSAVQAPKCQNDLKMWDSRSPDMVLSQYSRCLFFPLSSGVLLF